MAWRDGQSNAQTELEWPTKEEFRIVSKEQRLERLYDGET
jgi:hypothetical protein